MFFLLNSLIIKTMPMNVKTTSTIINQIQQRQFPLALNSPTLFVSTFSFSRLESARLLAVSSLTRLLEAGLTTRAQDYSPVLGHYVTSTVASAASVEQSTFPGWVNNTLYLAEKLKYLVRMI